MRPSHFIRTCSTVSRTRRSRKIGPVAQSRSILTIVDLENHSTVPSPARCAATRYSGPRSPRYVTFLTDPSHPSLHFEQVHPTRPIFSARVGLGHRALREEWRRGRLVLDWLPRS